MESLTEILLYKDLDNKIKKLKTRIRNYVKYDDQISKFSYLLKIDKLPILRDSKFDGKICFIEWIIKESVIYLSLNVIYDWMGNLAYIECLTKKGECVIVNNDGNLRTFDGVKFKKQVDISKIGKVSVVLVDKLLIIRG